ncbi:hypothetical protein OAH15_00370 [bacterium]|nr:hypothetical protein [bacterium]
MKSKKTFKDEYHRLKSIAGVFYGQEQDYEQVVFEGEKPPLENAFDQCKDYVGTTFGTTVIDPIEELLRLFQRLGEINLIDEVKSFVKEFFHNFPQKVRDDISEELLESSSGDRDKLIDVLREFDRLNTTSDRISPNEWAKKLLEWLTRELVEIDQNIPEQYEAVENTASVESVETIDEPFDPLDEGSCEFLDLPYEGWRVTRCIQTVYEKNARSGDDLVENILEATGVNIREAILYREKQLTSKGRRVVPCLDAQLGVDAFGTYLPFHAYGFSQTTPWGMYILPEALMKWADHVYLLEGGKTSQDYLEIFNLLYWTTYRHELFHYHVERYAFMLEVANRKPHYRPYVEKVRSAVANTEKWLEEALAQSVVLHSKILQDRSTYRKYDTLRILEREFKNFGPGYRDYDCTWTGGPELAHQRLGTQISMGKDVNIRNEWVTNIFIPKSQYSSERAKCPGYFAFTKGFISQFQLPMPNRKRWKRFAKEKGFEETSDWVGDHQVWKYGDQRVHINYKKGEMDFASIKAVSKIMGLPVRGVAIEAAKA